MVRAHELGWQNQTIPAQSDFRGVLVLGLLAAWFYFLWQFLSLPPLAPVAIALPPLLGFALDKARYMPDFGMIIAGCAAFHFHRALRREWDGAIARRLYVAVVVPLLAYVVAGLLLLEAVHLAGPGHHPVLPWQDPLVRVQVLVMIALIVCAPLWPILAQRMWTCDPTVALAGTVFGLAYFGMSFELGTHRLLWMWPLTALIDFTFGVCLCAGLFRAVAFMSAVRGPTILLGWFVMLGGSILSGPGMFFLGFLMILGGAVISERGWQLPGESFLRLWSRTALAIVLVQPAVFTAWLVWGIPEASSPRAVFMALALVTQILAAALTAFVERPARRLRPAMAA